MPIKYIIGILCSITVIGFTIGHTIAEKKYKNPEYSGIIFTTLVTADKNSSVLEKETASNFLGESIIGWTLSPGFTKSLGFNIDARKQERQNLIFQFSGISEEEVTEKSFKVENTIKAMLLNYNINSKTEFKLLFDDISIEKKNPKKYLLSITGAIAGFFLSLILIEIFRIIKKKKRRNSK